MNWIWRFLFSNAEIARDLVFLACIVFVCFVPRFGDGVFRRIEAFGSRLAARKLTAIVVVGLATILIRLSVLWVFPAPYPQVHDEFSYLLAGDTFVHGRVTNPAHPMALYLDTFHVNQRPTYESKYPPGQGLALALGQLLGNPWIGVLLTGGLMCSAALWMLQGWLPPRWASIGAIPVMFKVAIFSYWMNSYLGGFVAAIGGALVIGALPRILAAWRASGSPQAAQRCLWNAVILGVGTIIVANTRPYEGAFFCLPVLLVLLVQFLRAGATWRFAMARVIAPLLIVGALGGAFMAYYNWRGTGHATLMPYTVNERTYMNTPTFAWQKLRPARHYLNPQFEAFYNGNMQREWAFAGVTSLPKAARKLEYIAVITLFFFLWPQLSVTLLALGKVLRDRRVRLLLLQAALVFAVLLLPRAWFNLHYIAPLVATIFALATQGLRHVRRWTAWGRPVGVGITRVAIVFLVLYAPFNNDHKTRFDDYEPIKMRAQFAGELGAMPGKQLVIVQYAPQHIAAREWVYNGADIDDSKVVWAREIPGVSLQPLLDYFRGRQVWLVEPDVTPPRLSRYDAIAVRQGS